MLEKTPPAYTVVRFTTRVATTPLTLGSHGETVLSARMCARFDLGIPPTVVNPPPMYQPPAPSEATAMTLPRTFGNPLAGVPLALSMGIPPPVEGPTRPNSPPM